MTDSKELIRRLLHCANVGDMGREPNPDDIYRFAAAHIAALEASQNEHTIQLATGQQQLDDLANENTALRADLAKAVEGYEPLLLRLSIYQTVTNSKQLIADAQSFIKELKP
jgi:uncharacterized protein (DUF885 family)